jgi:hypothetical protein
LQPKTLSGQSRSATAGPVTFGWILRREVGDGLVGGLTEQKVAIGAEERQAQPRPERLILQLAFLGPGEPRLRVEGEIIPRRIIIDA